MSKDISETTSVSSDLLRSDFRRAPLDCMSISEIVKRSARNVETRSGVIDGSEIDDPAFEEQPPTAAALGAVPGNAGRAADERERRDVAEGWELFYETVLAVGACNAPHAAVGVVIRRVVARAHCKRRSGEQERGKHRQELHSGERRGVYFKSKAGTGSVTVERLNGYSSLPTS